MLVLDADIIYAFQEILEGLNMIPFQHQIIISAHCQNKTEIFNKNVLTIHSLQYTLSPKACKHFCLLYFLIKNDRRI